MFGVNSFILPSLFWPELPNTTEILLAPGNINHLCTFGLYNQTDYSVLKHTGILKGTRDFENISKISLPYSQVRSSLTMLSGTLVADTMVHYSTPPPTLPILPFPPQSQ